MDVRTLDDATITAIANDPDIVRAILDRSNLLTMDAIAKMIGISYYRVKILRGRRLELESEGAGGDMPRSDALPPSLPVPGDPMWHPREIEVWGQQTGRLDQQGRPKRALPTGRPRRQRTPNAA